MSEKAHERTAMPEASWVAQALQGDPQGFDALMRRYHGPLRRMLRAMVRNPQDAEDLLQETFLRAYRYLHRFDRQRPFGPWLLRIGSNLARDFLTRRARRAEVSLDGAPGATEEDPYEGDWIADTRPVEEVARRHLLDHTRRALQGLPAEQRTVLELRLLGELSYQEIASTLGIPVGTVMSRLNRGRRRIQRALGLRADGDEAHRAAQPAQPRDASRPAREAP